MTAAVSLDLDRLAALHSEGHTTAQIAERLGTTRGTTYKWTARLGLKANITTGRPRIPPEADEKLRELHAAGLNDHEIARGMGISRGAASSRRNRLGLKSNRPAGRPKTPMRVATHTDLLEKALDAPGTTACGRCGARWECTSMRAALAAFQDHKAYCPGAAPE